MTTTESDLIALENLPENDTSVILTASDKKEMASWMQSKIENLIPDKIVTALPSEWAERKRVLPEGLNRLPGAYSWTVNPYMRVPLDCLHPHNPTEIIDFMKGAQITYTVGFLENAIGWIIDENPGPTLFVSGDQATAEKNMELRIDRMIQEAGIAHKIFSQVQKKHNKKSGDTKSRKEFPGGFLIGIGPNSGAKLRNDSIQFLLMDEIDAAKTELKNEGSWMSSAEKRTNSFEGVRKIVSGSTLLMKDSSRIYKRFLLGSQEYYNVPCKGCKKLFVLNFFPDDNGKGGLRYDREDNGKLIQSSVRVHCPHCDTAHKNDDKSWLFAEKNGAKWIPTAEPMQPNRRSFHLNSLYAPIGFQSWESIASEWLSAQGNSELLQVFYNTVLGLPFENRVNAPSYEKIMIRKSGYVIGEIPPNFTPSIYVGGADVQGDRIEAHIIGFGRIEQNGRMVGKISASITYEPIPGDTSDISSKAWRQLEDVLSMTINGKPIQSFCVDAGYHTDTVYEFCSRYQSGIYPVMGSSRISDKKSIFQKFAVKNYPIERVDVNTDYLKGEIYNNLIKTIQEDGKVPHGYMYFPDNYPESFYRGLASEYRQKETDRNGFTKYVWKKISSGRRNEELDTTVYAWAALYIFAFEVCKDAGLESIDWDFFWDWCDENL